MSIQSVRFDSQCAVYEVTLVDGTILWVPSDPANTDYVRIQGWIAAGGIVS